MNDAKHVYLAYIVKDGEERVIVRGVFPDKADATRLKPLANETARNIVGVFESMDMGMHVGFTITVRRFPVLNQQSRRPRERKAMPRSVPWTFVETFRAQAEANHGQTLEQLASRGGLAPEEMWAASHAYGLNVLLNITPEKVQEAIDWLCAVTGEPAMM